MGTGLGTPLGVPPPYTSLGTPVLPTLCRTSLLHRVLTAVHRCTGREPWAQRGETAWVGGTQGGVSRETPLDPAREVSKLSGSPATNG